MIERSRAAVEYRKHQQKLAVAPLTDEEVSAVSAQRARLLKRYGKEFESNYGWAASILKRKPRFNNLEERSGLGHWRPYYRLASYGVHATPKSAMWTLSVGWLDEILLAGPSNAGLYEPGHAALISLNAATEALLKLDPKEEEAALKLEALTMLIDHAGQVFFDADRRLLDEQED
jgi:hypothetical protein